MTRVAAFIDGDNLGACHATALIRVAQSLGCVDVMRVYGNATTLGKWHDVSAVRVIHAGTGKNAADILLALDAMDLCLPGAFQTVLLASSDGDFIHLAQRLRERGLTVVGTGEEKATDAFRAACNEFVQLGGGSAPGPVSLIGELDRLICRVIRENTNENEGVPVNQINALVRRHQEVKIKSRKEKTWHAYLSARSELFSVEPKGPNARVRLKHKALSASA